MKQNMIDLFWIGNEKAVKLLIDNGATIIIKDSDGNEPLKMASDAGIVVIIINNTV